MRFIYKDVHFYRRVKFTLVEPDRLIFTPYTSMAPEIAEIEATDILAADKLFNEQTGKRATAANISCTILP